MSSKSVSDDCPVNVPLGSIRVEPTFQLRSKDGTLPLMEETAKEYAEGDLDQFPPIIVARSENDDLNNILLAGFTRLQAFKLAGRDTIPVKYVDVKTRKKAMRIAASSNAEHGLRPQKADLKLAMTRLEQEKISRTRIAEILKISNSKVTRMLGPKKTTEEKEQRKTIIRDPNQSNKAKAKKLKISPSAVSQAVGKDQQERKERREAFAKFIQERSEQNGAQGQVKFLQSEKTKQTNSRFSIASWCDEANDLCKCLGEAMQSGLIKRDSAVSAALVSVQKSIERVIQACKNRTEQVK